MLQLDLFNIAFGILLINFVHIIYLPTRNTINDSNTFNQMFGF